MVRRAAAGADYLCSLAGAGLVLLVVAAACGLAVAVTGGLVLSWVRPLAVLVGVAWFLLAVLLAERPAEAPRRLREVALWLAPLALLNVSLLVGLPFALTRLLTNAAWCGAVTVAAAQWVLPRCERLHPRWARVLGSTGTIWLVAALWAGLFATLTIGQWTNFHQFSQDMAIHEQAVYNTLHGRFLSYSCDIRYTALSMSRFADHFEPTVLLFVPLYLLWQSPVWFMLLQVLSLAAGAVPVAALARRWYGPGSVGLLFALIYLSHPGLSEALRYGVHMSTFTAGLLLWGLYLGLQRRTLPSLVCFVLALGCKENLAATVLLMGLYLAWQGQRRYGLSLAALSVAWFVAAVGFIIPACSPTGAWFYSGGLLRPEEVLRGDVWLWLGTRASYVLSMMSGVSALSLLSPSVLVLAAPELVVNCLGRAPWMHSLTAYYHVTAVPGIVLAGAAGLAASHRWLQRLGGGRLEALLLHRALLLFLALMALSAAHQERGRVLSLARLRPDLTAAEVRRLHALVRRVPDEVPVLVNDDALASHLARRPLLIFRFAPDPRDPDSVMPLYERADYVFLRVQLTDAQERAFRARYGLQLLGHVHGRWLWRVVPASPAAP